VAGAASIVAAMSVANARAPRVHKERVVIVHRPRACCRLEETGPPSSVGETAHFRFVVFASGFLPYSLWESCRQAVSGHGSNVRRKWLCIADRRDMAALCATIRAFWRICG
jgi:hypothetical protein